MLSLKKPSLPTRESVSSGNFFFQTFHILKFWMFLWKHYIVIFFNTVQQSLRVRSFNQFTFYVITKILVVTDHLLFSICSNCTIIIFLIFNFWSPFRLNVLLISISLFPPVLPIFYSPRFTLEIIAHILNLSKSYAPLQTIQGPKESI